MAMELHQPSAAPANVTFPQHAADLSFSVSFFFSPSEGGCGSVRTLTLAGSLAVVVVTEGAFGRAETRRQ